MPTIRIDLTPDEYDKIQARLSAGETLGQMLGVEVESLRMWEGDVDEQLGVQAARISGAETSLTTLQGKTQALDQATAGLTSDLATQKTRIGTLEKNDAAQVGEIGTIKSLNATQDARLGAIEGWKSTADGQFKSLADRLSALDTANAAAHKILTDRHAAIEGVNLSQGQAMTDLQRADAELGNRIDILTARLDALDATPQEPTP